MAAISLFFLASLSVGCIWKHLQIFLPAFHVLHSMFHNEPSDQVGQNVSFLSQCCTSVVSSCADFFVCSPCVIWIIEMLIKFFSKVCSPYSIILSAF